MSRQSEICVAVARALREAFSGTPGVTVELEDSCDPSAAAEKALGGWGVLVLVAASGHRRKPGTGASTAGDLAIDLTVVENPKRNRKSGTTVPTVTSVSEAAKDALHWFEAAGRRLLYVDMQRADVAEDDFRMVVRFVAPLALDSSMACGATPPPDGDKEPEEVVEGRIVALVAAAVPGLPVVGALAPSPGGEPKAMPLSRIRVTADVASQDLDWIGPGVPCSYSVRVEVRFASSDDGSGARFRNTCRAVRGALGALLGDGCAALCGDGFECDEFRLGATRTTDTDWTEAGGDMTKTYTATVNGRFIPPTETGEED